MMDQDYMRFVERINLLTSIDLSLYKEAQMKRRLTALRDKKNYASFSGYYDALKGDQRLMDEFLERMTINVSEFFRNPERWDVVRHRILPELIAQKRKLKLWSAACAAGEEPYTLSCLLHNESSKREYSILATDLDRDALKRAQEGIYDNNALKHVPEAIRSSCFSDTEKGTAIGAHLKKNIRFKQHNLLMDAFDDGFDLIVCRNVMIYFTEEAKEELFRKFSEALRPGGYLFLGSTEQIFYPGRFNLHTMEPFFYQKPIS
ncbi:protein-glutamate O-methyltransferase CheR [Fictibacillus enclensis]|nr:protein-glutamate O-methyltransferase CheR [Fictibacillus enclensis]MDM5199517.1 protein-glutamate O-methyltransferase CheR [Fictibacillus enclensis]